MKVLGIETSCDETAAAIVDENAAVLSDVIASSKDQFAHMSGVIPEEAARMQLECIQPVIQQACHDAHTSMNDLDLIAVTRGPGLLVSLLVGTTTARTLSSLYTIPIVGVHHTLGHLSSPWLDCTDNISFPVLTLSASGGHTELWYRTSHTTGILIGRTRDDAAGEAFDKGAHLLGLPYPGGPSISAHAEHGNAHAIDFPRPLLGKDTLDFSFSGLKTSLKYTLNDPNNKYTIPDLAASYQHALCSHLVDRILRATKKYPDVTEIHLVGGVSANTHLRHLLSSSTSIHVRAPVAMRYCTDNAAMIAYAGFLLYQNNPKHEQENFICNASLPLDAVTTY